ncbi:hypothetical protein [Enterococcus gallinarum]
MQKKITIKVLKKQLKIAFFRTFMRHPTKQENLSQKVEESLSTDQVT